MMIKLVLSCSQNQVLSGALGEFLLEISWTFSVEAVSGLPWPSWLVFDFSASWSPSLKVGRCLEQHLRIRLLFLAPRDVYFLGVHSYSRLNFMGGKLHANSCMALLFLGLIVWISWQETRRGVLFGQKQAQTIQQCAWHFTRNQAGFCAPLSPRYFEQN